MSRKDNCQKLTKFANEQSQIESPYIKLSENPLTFTKIQMCCGQITYSIDIY